MGSVLPKAQQQYFPLNMQTGILLDFTGFFFFKKLAVKSEGKPVAIEATSQENKRENTVTAHPHFLC